MFYFVIGMPGLFAEWCERVTSGLARKALGPVQLVHAASLEAITLAALRNGASRMVVTAHHAGGRLRAAITQAGHNFVVALDDPRQALAELVLHRQMDLPSATRAVASGCGSVYDYAATPGVLWLHAQTATDDGTVIAAAIAKHFGFAVSAKDIAAIVAEADREEYSPQQTQQWWANLSPDSLAMVEGALAGYSGADANGDMRFFSWTPQLFTGGDRPDEPLRGPIDITGRARCLLQGPSIILPHGAWRTKLRLGFSQSATDYQFTLEILAGETLLVRTVQASQAGERAFNMDFKVDETIDQPLTIRLSNMHAAFDGTIELIEMRLVSQPSS